MRLLHLSLFLPLVGSSFAQAPALRPSDLTPMLGNWSGELMYIDYTTSAETHIPATLLLTPVDARRWMIGYGYTDEPHANELDTLVLSADGRVLDDFDVLEVQRLSTDSIRFVVQAEGVDDERPATLRKTWTLGPHTCTVRKEVMLHPANGDAHLVFFLRHQYRFQR